MLLKDGTMLLKDGTMLLKDGSFVNVSGTSTVVGSSQGDHCLIVGMNMKLIASLTGEVHVKVIIGWYVVYQWFDGVGHPHFP